MASHLLTICWKLPWLVGYTQASMVNAFEKCKLMLSGTRTFAFPPLKLNAWPTWPGAKPAPLYNVPALESTASLALLSAAHQLTRAEAAATQPVLAGFTANTALELRIDPNEFVTRTA